MKTHFETCTFGGENLPKINSKNNGYAVGIKSKRKYEDVNYNNSFLNVGIFYLFAENTRSDRHLFCFASPLRAYIGYYFS